MINEINQMFQSHPTYHLFSGFIKILDNKYVVKSEGVIHHIGFDSLKKVQIQKVASLKSKGYLKLSYQKHNRSTDVYLYFQEDRLKEMTELYEKIKKEHQI